MAKALSRKGAHRVKRERSKRQATQLALATLFGFVPTHRLEWARHSLPANHPPFSDSQSSAERPTVGPLRLCDNEPERRYECRGLHC